MPATLVTGAAGFAASHLLDLLAPDAPGQIVAWHRPGATPPRELSGVTWQAVDLLDKASVASAIAKVQPAAVYHCAGAAHVGNSWSTTEATFAVNVRGTHHLIEALRDSVPDARLLIPSSALVYAPAGQRLREDDPLRPVSPYGVSKLAQELLGGGNADRPQVYIARPFNHVGPRQDARFVTSAFARQIAEIEAGRGAPVIEVGNLDAERDLSDVRDTVRAYRLILEHGIAGRPYNVCSGTAVSMRQVLDQFLSRARVPVRVVVDPARYRPNDQPLVVGDPGRIADEIGWTPDIPLSRTLDDVLEYWRSRAP